MSKHLRSIVAGLVFGSLALFSCSEKSPTASITENSPTEVGKAVVRLPDLSPKSLQKLPAGVSDSNALTLLIVAANMDTIKYSWPVFTLKGQQVVIEGIPAGKNRFFEGFLTAGGDLTHSGKVAVNIIAGQEVPVTLKLTGVGSADVCIEIEGYPSSCNQNDTFSVFPCLKGSSQTGPLTGTLKMYVFGDVAYGTLTLFGLRPNTTMFYEIGGYIKVQPDSIGNKYCQVIARERTTKIPHGLYLDISKNFEIVSGTLSTDTITRGMATIAKFYSVSCSTPAPDTISVSSCLNGYTPSESLRGYFNMFTDGKMVTGAFTLYNTKNGSIFGIYYFEKLIRLQDSSCQAIVIDSATNNPHHLNMIIKNSAVTYAYLSEDSLQHGNAIAKFYSVNCSTPAPDTISVSTCLNGSSPSGSLTGIFNMFTDGKIVSGSFTLFNTYTSSTIGAYYFKKLIRLQDSSCQAIVIDTATNYPHCLNMIIKNSAITYAYLSEDSSQHGNAIAKFYSVNCTTPAPDTTYIKVPFNGTGAYPDTVKFNATMAIKVANGRALGDFYFYNFPLIKNLSVSGIYQASSDSTSGYIDLISSDTTACYYSIVIKFSQGRYTGMINQKGTCGTKFIADLSSPTVIY
jgi:hypothetical protein